MKGFDEILDAALDELEESDDDSSCDKNETTTKTSPASHEAEEKRPMFGPPRPPSSTPKSQTISQFSSPPSEEEKAVMDMMKQMENLFPDKDFGKEGNTHVNITPEKKSSNSSKENDVTDTVSQLLKELSKNEQDMDINMTPDMQKEFEESMRNAAAGFNVDDEDAMSSVVDGMMKQLLSKEFMYEPMKDIADGYPKWLAENKDKISKEEYEKYGKQYQYFQKIVHLYENEPENHDRLSDLMNCLQEYGQPPADLVQELAPDLQFGDDGLPKMDGNMNMPGMDEDCIIM